MGNGIFMRLLSAKKMLDGLSSDIAQDREMGRQSINIGRQRIEKAKAIRSELLWTIKQIEKEYGIQNENKEER